MDVITTHSIGRDFVEIPDEIVLEDTAQTRIVFKAQMHPSGIRGDIIRYKKDLNGNNEEIISTDFRILHPNEGVRITLKTQAMEELYLQLKKMEALLEECGVHTGTNSYRVVDANSYVINDQNKAEIIRQLINANLGTEVWEQLVSNAPNIATQLANARLQDERRDILRSFEQMLTDTTLAESDWQRFFDDNTWIFGYGLRYQILELVTDQPNYGGTNITGRGGQRGDYLTATEAETKYTCLVEIKKPSTDLLGRDAYRQGVWSPSQELAGAVAQVQVNCAQWEIHGSRTEQNREIMNNVLTIAPKGIVVIGNTEQLNTWDKKNSFERFRRELHNPEIITYDELYERARFIVEGPVQQQEIEDEDFDDDLPF